MKVIYCIIICLITLSACKEKGNNKLTLQYNESVNQSKQEDEVVLALMPVIDCLPFYYASERDFFTRENVKAKIITYNSQFDCDTALIGKSADLAFCNLFRATILQRKNKNIRIKYSTQGVWELLVNKDLRIKGAKQLGYRTIATSRNSSEDYYVLSTKVLADETLLPQINNLYIRCTMLDKKQVDAAVLPEPFATQCRMKGHKALWKDSKLMLNFGCLLITQSADKKKMDAIIKAYNMAVDSINNRKNTAITIQHILHNVWNIDYIMIDSLKIPHYSHAKAPKQKEISEVRKYYNKK